MVLPARKLVVAMDDELVKQLKPTDSLQTAATDPLAPQRLLDLTNLLQTSLHMPDLIALFAHELKQDLNQRGVRYVNSGQESSDENNRDEFDILIGTEAPHRCAYQLEILDHPLGELVIMGDEPFTLAQIELLERLLSVLLYPLRNALLYARAIRCALRDPLTGVNNREAMHTYLTREIASARRHQTPLGLVLLDVDHFKQINDTYGHLVGDTVLTEIAQTIKECSRDSDIVFRYGGEEFVMVLANTGVSGAKRVAERVRKAVEKHVIDSANGQISATISAGVTTIRDKDTANDILARADRLMYQAKDLGRNRVVAE